MNLIEPKKLKPNDTIGIIALSGAIDDEQPIFRAKKYFEQKGFNIVLSENIFDKNRYLAGSDEKKVDELHKFFADPTINAILCARGGYGAIRLLDKIDYDLIKNNPKIFAGYSDISALLAMINKKCKFITYHSPMACGDFGQEHPSEYTTDFFFKTLCTNEHQSTFAEKVYFEETAKGITFGGNLSTIVSLCGQDFIPDEKFIFFTEDLNEPVYKIDKMLTQLLNIQKFNNNLEGIVFGKFSGIDNPAWLENLFFEIALKIKKPIISGLKITHETDKLTVPCGINSIIIKNRFEF